MTKTVRFKKKKIKENLQVIYLMVKDSIPPLRTKEVHSQQSYSVFYSKFLVQ